MNAEVWIKNTDDPQRPHRGLYNLDAAGYDKVALSQMDDDGSTLLE